MESFDYRRVQGSRTVCRGSSRPRSRWCPKATERRLVTGVNWSPGIVNPFRELGEFGPSLDTILTSSGSTLTSRSILILHMACPRVEYTDRGKTRLVLS